MDLKKKKKKKKKSFRLKTLVLDRLPEYPEHYLNYIWDTFSCSESHNQRKNNKKKNGANTFCKACLFQLFCNNTFSRLQIIKLYNVAWQISVTRGNIKIKWRLFLYDVQRIGNKIFHDFNNSWWRTTQKYKKCDWFVKRDFRKQILYITPKNYKFDICFRKKTNLLKIIFNEMQI